MTREPTSCQPTAPNWAIGGLGAEATTSTKPETAPHQKLALGFWGQTLAKATPIFRGPHVPRPPPLAHDPTRSPAHCMDPEDEFFPRKTAKPKFFPLTNPRSCAQKQEEVDGAAFDCPRVGTPTDRPRRQHKQCSHPEWDCDGLVNRSVAPAELLGKRNHQQHHGVLREDDSMAGCITQLAQAQSATFECGVSHNAG